MIGMKRSVTSAGVVLWPPYWAPVRGTLLAKCIYGSAAALLDDTIATMMAVNMSARDHGD